MFKNFTRRRKIRALKSQISELERKRERSQAALTEALLLNKEPADADVDFFNKYTAHIDLLRARINELQQRTEKGKTENES